MSEFRSGWTSGQPSSRTRVVGETSPATRPRPAPTGQGRASSPRMVPSAGRDPDLDTEVVHHVAPTHP
jgi:hypothetical protein